MNSPSPQRKNSPHSPLAKILVGAAIIGALFATYERSARAAGPNDSKAKEAPAAKISEQASLQTSISKDELNTPLGRLAPPRGAQPYPVPHLEKVVLQSPHKGELELTRLPHFTTTFAGRLAGITDNDNFVFFTLDPKLQAFTEKLVAQAQAPHVVVVAMDPKTGRILAMAGKSSEIIDPILHSGFPAASIFKLVTSAAAVESASVDPYLPVRFRGGTYTLNQWNISPDAKHDRKQMTLAEALGRSCNVVFARVALRALTPQVLRHYTQLFGFNRSLEADLPLPESAAFIPENDTYEFGKTAAGFGEVSLTPLHAVSMVSGIANGGLLPKPILIDRMVSPDGTIVFKSNPEALARIIQPNTAKTLLHMMEYTTTIGTSRGVFNPRKHPALPGISVAAKTGTLNGSNPEGVNHWFVAAAPAQNPKIALAIIIVKSGTGGAKAAKLGKQVIEQYLLH